MGKGTYGSKVGRPRVVPSNKTKTGRPMPSNRTNRNNRLSRAKRRGV